MRGVEAQPAHEVLGAVGCAEDAGGDDLLAACALARFFGELDEEAAPVAESLARELGPLSR